jgi:chromate transporter
MDDRGAGSARIPALARDALPDAALIGAQRISALCPDDPGWVTPDAFLAGYGAAQAVPGPLFTFGTYLGAVTNFGPNGLRGAAIGLVAIFLPGILVLLGTLPFWDALRARPLAQAAMRGTNAAVVGILGAALYSPVWTTAVLNPRDFALAVTAFVLLTVWKFAPWIVVLITAAGGVALALLPTA